MQPWSRRLLLVEDDALMSMLMAEVLRAAGFDVQVASGSVQARRLAESFDPDVALLDITLDDGPNGVYLAEAFRRKRPGMALMFLTHHPDIRSAGLDPTLVPPGCGFLRKDLVTDKAALVQAIESVLAEQAREVRHDLVGGRPLESLTSAQVDVLRMVAMGMTNEAIARQRGTTERSVERRLSAVFRALGIDALPGVNPRVEAARLYIDAAGVPSRLQVGRDTGQSGGH